MVNRGEQAAATNGGFSSGGEWSGQAAMANGKWSSGGGGEWGVRGLSERRRLMGQISSEEGGDK